MVRAIVMAIALAGAVPAMAQPLPSTIRSASLTQAQQNELDRRLVTLQGRFNALAGETSLREGAVRNIAVEIFGAQPDLDFDTYAGLIDTGTRELRALLGDARGRVEADPARAALRQRAIAAAEEGRLTDARALYDELIAANRAVRRQVRDTEDLADAADIGEAARLAFVAADFRDAARRYGEAADLAPEGSSPARDYRLDQAGALREQGERFGDPANLRAALEVLRTHVAPAVQRGSGDWSNLRWREGYILFRLGEGGDVSALRASVEAYRDVLSVIPASDASARAATQLNLGNSLQRLAELGDPSQLALAIEAYQSALGVLDRNSQREQWIDTQSGLGSALRVLGDRGDAGAYQRSAEALEQALGATDRTADPAQWANTQLNLAGPLMRIDTSASVDRAIEALRQAQTVFTRERYPVLWARANLNLGSAYFLKDAHGQPSALRDSVRAYQDALSVITRDTNARSWALAQYGLANSLLVMIEGGERSHLIAALNAARAAVSGYEQVGMDATYPRSIQTSLERIQTQGR